MITRHESRAIVRQALKRVPEGEEIRHLNIMPMMDIMTILLVAFLFSAAQDAALSIADASLPPSRSFDPKSEQATTVTISKTGINLTSGNHLMRLALDTNNSSGSVANFNWIGFFGTSVTPPPAAPTNLAANAPDSSTVNLTWTDNSNNESGFIIERKTGSGGTYAQIAMVGANVTSYADQSVTAATTYFYRVRAMNDAGASAYSATVNIRSK